MIFRRAKRRIPAFESSISAKNAGILRGVYPERQSEMLRFAQHDSEWAQNDRQWGYPLRVTDIAYQTLAPFRSRVSTDKQPNVEVNRHYYYGPRTNAQ